MRKIISFLFVLLILISGCTKGDAPIYSGGWTKEDIKVMEESWCKYNRGRDFAITQCSN